MKKLFLLCLSVFALSYCSPASQQTRATAEADALKVCSDIAKARALEVKYGLLPDAGGGGEAGSK